MSRLKKLQDTYNRGIAEARAIADVAEKESRDMTPEEEQRFDAFLAESDKAEESIKREERLGAKEAEANAVADEYLDRNSEGEYREGYGERGQAELEQRLEEACTNYLASNQAVVSEELRQYSETRAAQADNSSSGGIFLPSRTVDGIIMNVDKRVFMRQHATVLQLTDAANLGVISLDTDASDPTHVGEIETRPAGTDLAFGKRELNPRHMGEEFKISKTLLRKHPKIWNFLQKRIAYRFAHQQEEDFMTGNGAGKSLGVFTASDNGIPASRDISTGNTTTAITYDGVIECYFNLEEEYINDARWLFHRQAKRQLALLKDGEGIPLWRPRGGNGNDELYGLPCDSSRFAPSTFTAGQYVGMLAAWEYYYIAEALSMTIQKLVEKYASTNEIGFMANAEIDGMPVLAEAFSRMKLAAA